jgi:HPt (histidine-containing phosphotransfer) domain-containing protein
MRSEIKPLNETIFMKMAHGDMGGLKKLAFDYFNDTRRQMTGWLSLIESNNYGQLRDDLHRCKGGASLFGLERIVAVIGSCESAAVIEEKGFDVRTFEEELTAAEQAVLALPD